MSWGSGEVPCDWKLGSIIVICKKGMRENPGNHRPISLTCTVDDGKAVDVIFLDVSKAFHTVPQKYPSGQVVHL